MYINIKVFLKAIAVLIGSVSLIIVAGIFLPVFILSYSISTAIEVLNLKKVVKYLYFKS